MSSPDIGYLNKRLSQILDKIYLLKDDEGIEFQEVFHILPLRSNTGYYKVIRRPMSYSKIRQAIKHQRYSNPQQFVEDVAQITWNARYFNEESSPFYRWATVLDEYLRSVIIPDLQANTKLFGHGEVAYPDLGSLPGQNNSGAMQIQTPIETPTESPIPELPVASLEPSPQPETPPQPSNFQSGLPDFAAAAQPHPQTMSPSGFSPQAHSGSSRHPIIPNYNPAAYEAHVEPNDHPIIYSPPRISNAGVSNRQLLEQWVKRGRPPIVDKPHEQRIKSIMRGLKKVKVNGKTIIAVFDKLPNQQDHPEFYRMIRDPISMLDIKGLIKQRYYKSVDAYMADVFRLITNGKQYYPAVEDSFSANNIHLLETNIVRLYHQEMAKPDSDYIGDLQSSKMPLGQVIFEGRVYKVGNWVLMKNPNDAGRPIPGQIFRIWQEHGKQYLNVCWYYRPEWTTHRFDRLFLENEVFKTGQYRDHPVEDIVGPCYVAYFTRWLKGDPGVKYEGPLFICEFRYNDRELNFAKIRTWKACLPDEVRHIEDPIFPIDRPRVLKKFPSPIKHLLPPGSTPSTMVPPPTILNLNAPPLVGGIYVKRPDDEDEINYFDANLRQDQYKILIPPALNLRSSTPGSESRAESHGLGSNSPQPTQYSPPKPTAVQFSVNQLHAGSLPPYLPAALNQNDLDSSRNDIPPYALDLQQQLQESSGQGGQQAYRYQQPDFLVEHYSTHSYSGGGGHKVVHTPYNSVSYQFSPYTQASFSQSFIQPSNRERLLPKFARENYDKAGLANYQRFSKILEKQNYLEMSSGDSMVTVEQLQEELEAGSEDLSPLLWFKAPPQYIPNRILNTGAAAEDQLSNNLNPVLKKRKLPVGLKAIKLGHSSRYLAWKLKQKEELGIELAEFAESGEAAD
ncbi:DEKNAAC104019 [Brettanomyces naardenensis]|uniref:DEKNAAC104019 n=1 Tax=Brettanomyces naardenensis TaxID=13370 RepID=A0A448YQ65_BRENA|nr:DEKNAAC104019 [Brettanomyces naardenensis]